MNFKQQIQISNQFISDWEHHPSERPEDGLLMMYIIRIKKRKGSRYGKDKEIFLRHSRLQILLSNVKEDSKAQPKLNYTKKISS